MPTNDFLVFDLETQKSAEEVGGWSNIKDMKFSVAVVWDSKKNDFFTYYHDRQCCQLQELVDHLCCGSRVIGFNHLYFDYEVLLGYYKGSEQEALLAKLSSQGNLDLLIAIKKEIGKRIRLDNVASATLEIGKSADGLDALAWYKKYQETADETYLEKIATYCQQDVKVTRDLYLYGLEKGYIYYENYKEKRSSATKIIVSWQEALTPYKIRKTQPERPKSSTQTLF